jgi:hypothetical protein
MKTMPKVGTFIRAMRQPVDSHIGTITGLRGWVSHTFPEENSLIAVLIEERMLGGLNATSESMKPGDYVVIKPNSSLLKKFAEWEDKQKQPKDPQVEALFSRVHAEADRFVKENEEVEKGKQGKVNPYLLPNGLARNSKFNFPTYQEFELAGHGQSKRFIASQERKLTIAEKVMLTWLNQASDRTSFWSGDKRIRALVQELDLDPLIRRFDGALYCGEKKFFVPARKVRVIVIREINRGRLILSIAGGKLDGKAEELTACGEEPTHFYITTARRRKLPAIE